MLPENRSAGMLPWIIAIMVFLTALASWGGLSLTSATGRLETDIGTHLTVQLAEPNVRLRAAQVKALEDELPKLALVTSVRRVDDDRLQALLEPWLGDAARDPDLPLPALFELETTSADDAARAQLAQAVQGVAPGAHISADAEWIAPALGFLQALQFLAVALIVLMMLATGAIVVMAVRAALNTHADTIEIMHMMGAGDRHIASLFERRIARDAFLGGLLGVIGAGLAILPIEWRLDALAGGLGDVNSRDWWILPLFALLPVFGMVFARLVARSTVLSALRRSL